jgi:hypothetical protein
VFGYLIRYEGHSSEAAVEIERNMRIKHGGQNVLKSRKAVRFMKQIMRVHELNYKIPHYVVPTDRLDSDML